MQQSNTKPLIYESPDKGKTVYAREFGSLERKLIKEPSKDNAKVS